MASALLSAPEEGPQPRDAVRQTTSCRADLMAATGHFSRPPAGTFVAVSGQFLVAAVTDGRLLHAAPPLDLKPHHPRGLSSQRRRTRSSPFTGIDQLAACPQLLAALSRRAARTGLASRSSASY